MNIVTDINGNVIAESGTVIIGSNGLETRRGLISWQAARLEPVLADSTAQVQLSDFSKNGSILTQATAGDRALYRTNQINGLPAFQFVSSDIYNWTNKALLRNVTGASFSAIYKKTSGVGNQTLFYFSINSSLSGRFGFTNNIATDLNCSFSCRRLDADSASPIQVYQNSTDVFAVIGTVDYVTGKQILYINGVLISSVTLPNPGGATQNNDSLCATIGGTNPFIGLLSELRVANATWSESEVAQEFKLLNDLYNVY